ncbi:hypothetical protein TNCT_585252, partial [Trichonephila clavata]
YNTTAKFGSFDGNFEDASLKCGSTFKESEGIHS